MDTKENIILAAKEEFFQKGFDAARMRSISERSGINKGLLHYYFKSKESLLLEVFQRTFSKFFERIALTLKKDLDLHEMIRSVVEMYIEHMSLNPHLPGFIINEMNRNPQRHFERMKKAAIKPPLKPLIEAFERGKKNGTVRSDADALHFVINMMSMTLFPFIAKNMLIYMHGMDDEQYDAFIKKRSKEITHTLIQSLKATEQS